MGAELNMEIARRVAICISGDVRFIKKTIAGSSFKVFARQTDRLQGPLSFAVSAVETQSPLTVFFSSLK